MKKLINGLRRKSTTPPPIPITTNEPEETNYAILFDNDQDESTKENTHNTNNPTKTKNTGIKKGGKPRRRKKRISKPIMNGGASRGMQTMMTISEIVEEGIEVDDFLAEREHEEGEDETVIVEVDEMVDEGVSIVESGVPEEDSDEISEDIVAEVPANLNDSGAIYSDSDSSEECVAEDGEELSESLINLEEESEVGEKRVDNNNDIDEVNCEEVIVAPTEGESSTDEVVIDESDYDSSEEIITQEMNSAEAVQQQQQKQQQQDSHYNINHRCQSPITEISKENARHEYLKSIGLYTPSSFMQSLRLKYRVDLECHA